MAVTRIWNITDGGQEGIKPHTRMVLGQSLKPGQFMRVETTRIVGATKLQKEVNARFLHVGAQPPRWYAQKKKPERAVADGRIVGEDGRAVGKKVAVAKGHGLLPVAEAPVVSPAPDPVEAPVTEAVADVAPEVVPEKIEPEEKPEEEISGGFGRRRKKNK